MREVFDQRSPNSSRMHGRRTPEQNDFFRLGASPEVYSPVQRLQRRQEVLQAFEVLITKMESRFTPTGNTTSDSTQINLEKGQSIRSNLWWKQWSVISEMKSPGWNLNWEIEDLLLRTIRGLRHSAIACHSSLHVLTNTEIQKARSLPCWLLLRCFVDDFPGFSVHGQDSKAKRIHSVPISSSLFPVAFPETSPIERSVSCFTELQSAPLSILDSYVPSRKDGTKERLAKIAMFNEVRPPIASPSDCVSAGDAPNERQQQPGSRLDMIGRRLIRSRTVGVQFITGLVKTQSLLRAQSCTGCI